MKEISRSEVTPEHIFLNRRKFMIGAGSVAGALTLAACGINRGESLMPDSASDSAVAPAPVVSDLPEVLAYPEPYASVAVDELGDDLNTFKEITNYNNYYEFDTNKQAVAKLSGDFTTTPWEIEVTGMVNKPRTFNLEDLINGFTQQERIYRLRCVEAWSMVIPWVGFPLAELLSAVEPTADAKYVAFTSVFRPDEMPGQSSPWLKWPYAEGLRVDEAMNDLALMATGMYGKPLVNQNGAPIRLVLPWKYGFKSAKAIVKIELTDTMPVSTWMDSAPNEYGFYANVNPEVDHPRWSQATERRIGESGRRESLMFNGYEDEVAYLYEGMDLRENF